MGFVKMLLALVMLAIMAGMTFIFGIVGLAVGFVLSIVLSMMISRMEREKLEERRHKELLEATRKATQSKE
ncbi:hypothetical protein [Vibrio furnissii]|uniref:hypothetical protein n=1 Tax=Vibrio furnissii TaxID=29494 RepID=UPI0037518E0B